MPPKAGSKIATSLVAFLPTDDELAAARSILASADTKQRKSKINATNTFLQANIDAPGNADALKSTGTDRQAYIEKYMAFQSAKKSGRMVNTRSNIVEKTKFADVHFWNKYKCEKEVGPETFATWIESKKLDYIKDEVTQSDAEHMRIYLVPMSWTRLAQGEKDQQQIETDGAASSADLDNFNSVRDQEGVSSSSGGGMVPHPLAQVKPELVSAEDKQKAEILVFEAEKNGNMMWLSSSITELKIITVTAADDKMTAPLSESAKTLCTKFTKLAKTFDQWVADPTCLKEKGLGLLMKQMASLRAEKNDVERWAAKLDVKTGAPAPKNKSRKA